VTASPRQRALNVLVEVARGQVFLDQCLRAEDPPFVRELVAGVLRRRLTLDTIHDAFGKRPASTLDPEVLQAVRLGLYQFVFLDGVPPHAAVGETVGALRLASHRAYVNGLLRGVLRECHRVTPDRDRGGAHPSKRFERPGRAVFFFSRAVFPDPEREPLAAVAVETSHPEFLVRRWVERVGEATARAWLEEGNRTPLLTLRPRPGRCDATALVQRLAAEGAPSRLVEREHGPAVVELAPGGRVLDGKAFRQGWFSVQEAAQMDAVEILAPRAGEVVWDACAAPGGKTAQLAELLPAGARLVASDRSSERLQPMHENLARLGLDDVLVAEHDLLSEATPPGRPARGFDAILLDAPCSNTAVLARRPEARWRLQPGSFAELAELQARLIEAARRHLAPGGRLVFSTCSREPEEGAQHGLQPTRSPYVWCEQREG